MPRRLVPLPIKERIPILFHEQGFSVKQICTILGVQKSLVYQTLQYYQLFGTSYNVHADPRHGRRRILSVVDCNFIASLLQQRHTAYLDEIQDELYIRRGIHTSIPTLLRTMRRLHFSSKGVTAPALERNDLDRAIFMNRIADLIPNPDMLMFVDEAAKNKRTSARRHGWSLVGRRCVQRRCFVRGERFSILPVLTLDGIITHDIIHGSVTSAKFIDFIRELVIPLTNPYPGPRSVLILDNCNIHRLEELRTLVEEDAQCKLVFLPPYSPDLNPIEQAFSSVKSFLRRHSSDSSLGIIDLACQNITADKAWGFFKASGYVV